MTSDPVNAPSVSDPDHLLPEIVARVEELLERETATIAATADYAEARRMLDVNDALARQFWRDALAFEGLPTEQMAVTFMASPDNHFLALYQISALIAYRWARRCREITEQQREAQTP